MCSLKDSDKEFIRAICEEYNFDSGELISILHKVQKKFGFLPRHVQQCVADELKLPISRVYGVVSFYAFFTMTPKGKFPISVCTGTACYVRGVDDVLREFERQLHIKNGEVTHDGQFSLNTLRCVGACGLAPVVMVGNKIYGKATPAMVLEIIDTYKNL